MITNKHHLFFFIVLIFILLSQVIYAEGIAPVEITSLRNANTRVWQNTRIEPEIDLVTGIPTQSQRTTVRYIYEKADGLNYNASTVKRPDWRPTVETFQSVQDANYPYQVNQGLYQIKFNTGVSASYPITYQINGKTMQLGLRELAFYNPKTQTLTPLQSFQRSAPTVTGNKIRYSNAFSGIDVEYVYTKNSFQQNLIAQSLEAIPNPIQYGISSTDAYLVSVTEINLDNFPSLIKNHKGEGFAYNFLSGENGEILFQDTSNNQPICQFNLSQAIDNQHQQKSMYKHLMQLNGQYYLVEGVPYTWLQTAQYPVVLDYELKTGTSSINEVWKSGNTYFISGEYTIGNGYTLVIEPGTVCKFSTGCLITAGTNARIIAKGEAYNYILFTSWKDAINGESVSTYSTPTAGDYYTTIYLSYNSSSLCQIEYCKFAYANQAICLVYQDQLINNPIRNNIFSECYYGINIGGCSGGTAVINNNLFTNIKSYGINLGFSDMPPLVNAINNTFDHCSIAIKGNNYSFTTCNNNLITNCNIALKSDYSNFGNHAYNRFYNNITTYYNVTAGSNETTLSQNPYVVSANGSYYLNQTNTGVINAGDTTVPSYLRKKTTTAPNWVATDISTSATWSKVPRDTGKIDIGFHYDPVDYVVGTTNKMLITVDNATTPARLTILPGVVVSFWRNVTTYNGQLMINQGDVIAHGHADDRIQFDSIYATGDEITYALGTDSFSYLKAIRLGSGVGGMETIIQNCEFNNCYSGIYMDDSRQNKCYRLFSDNLFKSCNYGIVVLDSFVRIYNNLFMSGNNGIYSVYVANNNHSNDSCYVWNNTMDGEYKSKKGIYAYSGSTDGIDIRNNTITGYTEHGIYLSSDYSGTTIYNNCLYNNVADYNSGISAISTISQNPRFVFKGTNQSNDGYYLAQTTGNVSQRPYRNDSYLEEIDVFGITNFPYQFRIMVNSYPNVNSGYYLGSYTYSGGDGSGDYSDSAVNYSTYGPGYIYLDIQNGGVDSWTLQNGDYIKLIFANGKQLKVYLPNKTINGYENPEGPYLSLMLWAAQDGSSYYADQQHQAGYSLNQDADYAMSYDTAGLSASSYTYLGKSPCVNAGDTTIRAYGSTHTSLTKNSQRVDIGYHPLNKGVIQVSELGRLFEYEDGTPFIPIGSNPYCPEIFTNHDIDTWSKVSEYLTWYSGHGLNNIAIGGSSFTPDSYKHFSTDTDWKSFQRPVGSFQTTMFQDFTKLLDYADINNLTYYLGVLRTQVHNFKYDDPASMQYNQWFSGSTIFFNDYDQISFSGISTPIEILSTENGYAIQTNSMKYYIDQWGNREGIFFWEPLVEMNYIGEGNTNVAAIDTIKREWIEKMVTFMHQYEILKFGRKHLVSISSGAANPWPVFSASTSTTSTSTTTTGSQRYFDEKSWGLRHAPTYLFDSTSTQAQTYWYDTTNTQKCFFNHPKLDFVSIHPIIGDTTNFVTFFPVTIPCYCWG